jgi:hypothetical protein
LGVGNWRLGIGDWEAGKKLRRRDFLEGFGIGLLGCLRDNFKIQIREIL